MKIAFYSRLGWTNLKKNARLYVPNILAGVGLLSVFYIMLTLSYDERLTQVRGGSYLPYLMPVGVFVLAILSVILLLYTNSFVMKQRSREFGLYNVLGMEKRHIMRVLFWESVICTITVLIGGLTVGILFYNLCSMIICRLLHVQSILRLQSISLLRASESALFFLVIYVLAYGANCIRIARLKPVELMASAHTGEKEPKIHWVLLIVGIATLAGGYAISLLTKSPLQSIYLFFPAVALVIIGTYCLFTTGSITFLKLLKSRKTYYYQKSHMPAISGLLYRMKQNAVGLSSICILATGVLVMVSTTFSMYTGISDTIRAQYPHDVRRFIVTEWGFTGDPENPSNEDVFFHTIPDEELTEIATAAAADCDLSFSYIGSQSYLSTGFLLTGSTLSMDRATNDASILGDVLQCFFITAAEYEKETGIDLGLADNEVAVYTVPTNEIRMPNVFSIGDRTFTVTSHPNSFPIGMGDYSVVNCFGIIVRDEETLLSIEEMQAEAYEEDASKIEHYLVLDFADEKKAEETYRDFEYALSTRLMKRFDSNEYSYGYSFDLKWATAEDLNAMYGTFLFLGLLLSIVFLFATALIIYYKQISEGYEDRERYQIMQKVGMSREEVRKTIRTQVLLVFALPLVTAAIHMAFAFPILTRLLKIMFQSNRMLFVLCTVVALAIFAVIYVVIYLLTARTYYHIVE